MALSKLAQEILKSFKYHYNTKVINGNYPLLTMKTMMTDSDKLFALTEIMNDVIYTLEMKQYDIEDATLSHECVTDADKFRQIVNDILYSEEN